MDVKAYAKINLGLDVLGRRQDGYHEVRMVMQQLELCDEMVHVFLMKKGFFLRACTGAAFGL